MGSFQLGSWEEEAFTKGRQPPSLVLVWQRSQERAAPAASMQAAGCGAQQPELQGEERGHGRGEGWGPQSTRAKRVYFCKIKIENA